MPQQLYTVAVLACPIGMGLMMWMMMRGPDRRAAPRVAADSERVAQLDAARADSDQLKTERTASGAGAR